MKQICYTNSSKPYQCTSMQTHLVILIRKLSTSSKTLGDKKLEKSVEPGVRDRGGMCCNAFLVERTEHNISKPDRIRKNSLLQ